MYNTFLNERIINRDQAQILSNKKAQRIKFKSYKFREKLIQKYQKRIQNFIYKMEDQPLTLNDYDEGKLKNSLNPFRQSNLDNSIHKTRLTFRSPEDWKSILTSMERSQRKTHQTIDHSQNRKSELLYRDLRSQEHYRGNEKSDKYRTREKQKQIHMQPMRFTFMDRVISKREKYLTITEQQQYKKKLQDQDFEKRNNTNSSGSLTYEDQNSSEASKLNKRMFKEIEKKQLNDSKMSENQSRKSSYNYSKKSQLISINERESLIEKNKNFENYPKVHFKAVMDILIRKKSLSNNARNVLKKCHYLKQKAKDDDEEKDMLQVINSSNSPKRDDEN